MKQFLLITICVFISFTEIFAETKKVPQEFSTIQEAIDEAMEGDTVLVDTGVYHENIVFRGKDIVLTSYYEIRDDFNVIFETIIDGSQSDTDTTNTVSIINGETANTVLEGFTITGGIPGVTVDLEGMYPEGGGLIVRYSSPEIKFNYFTSNGSTTLSGYNGSGALSTSYSSSHIHNNIFYKNAAMAGGACIDNNSSVIFNNNLVVANESTSGWGGIVLSYTRPENPVDTSYYYNNTIVGNINRTSNNIGVFQSSGNKVLIATNNIVYGNANVDDQHIRTRLEGVFVAEYNTFPEGNYEENNNSAYPAFVPRQFLLSSNSPCIDAGDPSNEYLDIEDPDVADEPEFPSQGTLRNDQGCYGGPFASLFSIEHEAAIFSFTSSLSHQGMQGETVSKDLRIFNTGADTLHIDSITTGHNSFYVSDYQQSIRAFTDTSITVNWEVQENELYDTLNVYHNDTDSPNPLKIALHGKTNVVDAMEESHTNLQVDIYPNPVHSIFHVRLPRSETGKVHILALNGRQLNTISFNDSSNVLIDVGDLKPGMYLIKVETTAGMAIKKVSVID